MSSHTQIKATVSLALVFAVRMLGLFMILPVFALFAHELSGSTSALIGLALGAYGLTQAFLQIPLGMLSDRVGRKPVIALGLLVFVLGSVVAALSTSIYGVIAGRVLQGAGAVGSTIIALVADLTSTENRTKSMAVIGMTIGVSFAVAMVLGPLVARWYALSGIFWLTALLGLVAIALVYLAVPTPDQTRHHKDCEPVPALFKKVLKDVHLLRLDFGIAAQHAILTATFTALPHILTSEAGLQPANHWLIYLPVLVLSFIAMVPFIIMAEKHGKMKPVFLGAVALIALTQLSLASFTQTLISAAVLLLLFFGAFSLLEAVLPSSVSKLAPEDSKGTALGVYSSSQFMGIFIGGSLGGTVLTYLGIHGVFGVCAAMAAIWFVVAAPGRYTKLK